MTVFKKIIFAVFVCLSIAAGIWAYALLKNSKKPKVEAVSVLPDSCLVYINTHDFFELSRKINSQSLIADKLKLFGSIGSVCNTIQRFDSLFSSYNEIKAQVAENLIHLALYNKAPNWLITFNIKQLGSEDLINEALVKVLNAKKTESGIYSFELTKQEKTYFHLKAGVIMLSDSKRLLSLCDDANYPRFENSEAYREFKNTLTENDLCSLYLNHNLYSSNKASQNINLTTLCKKALSAGEIDIQPSELRINGYLVADSSELIYALANQEPQTSEDLPKILPYNTTSFQAFGFHSLSELKNNLNKIKSDENASFWSEINQLALYDVELEFCNNVNKSIVGFKTTLSSNEIICMPVNDTLKAKEHLGFMSDSVVSEAVSQIHILKKISTGDGLKLFGPLFKSRTSFAALYQSCLFFSESKSELIQTLTAIKNRLFLDNNESFSNYRNEHFVDEFNYLFYCGPNRMGREISDFFNFKTDSEKNPLENLKHFSYSLTNASNNFKFRLQLLNEAESNTRDQNVLWTMNMDTAAAMSAFNFLNHMTQENELVIQDDARNLYLLNAKGSLLWKKKISEKIISSIHVVDAFKNNKYQLLFNSKNHLHLMDRNGNYVEGYPVKLPSEATSEISILDYDLNKDYRIFISCKNNRIYNYTIRGALVDGFNPVKTENDVNLPLQYAKVGLSDYIVAVDKEGKIYTFGRKGQGRIGLKNRTIANCPAFYVDATNNINTTYIVYLDDKSALINKISFSDRKEIIKVEQETQNASVSFDLIDENRGMDFIVTQGNRILIYDLNGDLLFEKVLKGSLSKTGFYNDESHSLFYSLDHEKQELVIYNQLKQSTLILKANAMPLINKLFKDNKKYLILTFGNQLSCVPLN